MKCYDGPLTGNLKCVVISLLFASMYWFAPPKNKWVLAGILGETAQHKQYNNLCPSAARKILVVDVVVLLLLAMLFPKFVSWSPK